MLLIYEILSNSSSQYITDEYMLSSTTVASWSQFVTELMLDYLKSHSEKIGGANKIVEIDHGQLYKAQTGHESTSKRWIVGGSDTADEGKCFVTIFERMDEVSLTRSFLFQPSFL